MNDIYDFLKECKVFYLLTLNNGIPAGRPFGAVMKYNDVLYISTSNTKAVYQQLIENPHIQIIALKQGTRNWIRLNAEAFECMDFHIKAKMLHECPELKSHFSSEKCEFYSLFALRNLEAEFF